MEYHSTDNHPVEELFSGKAAVGGGSGFLELRIRSGRIIKSHVVKTLQFCQIVIGRFCFSKDSFGKVLLLLLAMI